MNMYLVPTMCPAWGSLFHVYVYDFTKISQQLYEVGHF